MLRALSAQKSGRLVLSLNWRNDLSVYAALPGPPAVAAGRQHDSSVGAGGWCPQRGGRGEERGCGLSTGSEQLHSARKTGN